MDKAIHIQTEYVMGNDVYVYVVRLPGHDIKEAVMPCMTGYTVYLDDRLSPDGQKLAYKHALHPIVNNDLEKYDVSEIELHAP